MAASSGTSTGTSSGSGPGELALAATACMFLTRLPVGRWASGDPAALAAATRYFPLVGAIIALAQTVVFALVAHWLPLPVALLFVLAGGVILTGAFHEDGLADVADSAGAFDRERKLAIMRDSRIGTYGAVSLILLFAFRYSALWSIVNPASEAMVAAGGLVTSAGVDAVAQTPVLFISLLAAHALARWSLLLLMFSEPYARAEAPNRVVASGVTARRLAIGTALVAVLVLPAILWFGIFWSLLLPLALVLTLLCGRLFRRWYGGITGDCLGAANQVVEVGVLIAIGAAP